MSNEAAERRRAIRIALEEALERAVEDALTDANESGVEDEHGRRRPARSPAAPDILRIEAFEIALARSGYFVGTIREVVP